MESEYCQKLRKILNTEEYVIKTTKVPKYLSCFGYNYNNIILFHKWEKSQETFNHAEKFSSVSSSSELEITGNPLEYSFLDEITLNDTVFIKRPQKTEEDFHMPIKLDQARYCLGISNMYVKPDIPVWALVEPEKKDAQVLLGAHTLNGWYFRSWANIQKKQALTNNISNIISEHKKLAKLYNTQVNTKVTSYFSPLECSNSEEALESSEQAITLKVTWTTPSFEVPLNEADTLLVIKTLVGSKDNASSPIWQQVLLLNMYLDTMIKWRKERAQQIPYQQDTFQIPSRRDVFPVGCTFRDSVQPAETLKDRILNLLTVSNNILLSRDSTRSKTETTSSKKTKKIMEEVISGHYPGQDFTSKLWNLLIDAGSYQELASSIQLVFQEVKTRSNKPYILRSNKTRLAQALHNANSDTNTELLFEPLELLLELGIEKLKLDYLYIFNLLQLANKEQLAMPDLPNFSQTTSSNLEPTLRTWLNWFASIHIVLDIVSLTEEKLILNTGSTLLSSICSVALKTYLGTNSPVSTVEGIMANPLHKVEAAVKTSDVSQYIGKDCHFYEWLLNLKSSSASHSVFSSYLITLNLPFPDNILKKVADKNPSDESVSVDGTITGDMKLLYYTAKLTTVGDKLF